MANLNVKISIRHSKCKKQNRLFGLENGLDDPELFALPHRCTHVFHTLSVSPMPHHFFTIPKAIFKADTNTGRLPFVFLSISHSANEGKIRQPYIFITCFSCKLKQVKIYFVFLLLLFSNTMLKNKNKPTNLILH